MEVLVNQKGVTRIVFLIGNYAIKIPNFTVCHLHFLHGCYANWSERHYCKIMKNIENDKFYNLVAPSIFCSFFGLIQVQKRCIELDRHLTDDEILKFKDICNDIKKENFGYFNGILVCLDYA